MAITQGQCTSFKQNLLEGNENFSNTSPYTYKIALYTANANIGTDTLVYTTDNEVSGTGYTAGGKNLTIIPAELDQSNKTAYVSFNNVSWDNAAFTARGALIYNGNTNASVAVLNFGSDKSSNGASFTVQFPGFTSTTAVIRIN